MRQVERCVWRGRSFVHLLKTWTRAPLRGALGTTTCDRYGPACCLAPLGAGAETLEDDRDHAGDKRQPVETCLHHDSMTSVSSGSPLESLSSPGCRSGL